MNRLLYLTTLVFIISCVFDPADKILRLKLPLFCVCWILALGNAKFNDEPLTIPSWMVKYLGTFLSIPILSIIYYYIFINGIPYDGIQYLKSYLLLTIIIVLYISRNDIMKPICLVLTALSIVIIVVFIITYNNPSLLEMLFQLGEDYDCIWLGYRQYGSVGFYTIFYKTSPMIAISIAYYVFMSIEQYGIRRLLYLLLSFINIVAMYMAGTRNNILTALCLPLVILLVFTKYTKIIVVILLCTGIVAYTVYIKDIVGDMFSPRDESNSIKISYLNDYKVIFDNPITLLFGEGVGSYNYWSIIGVDQSNTELTYLEIFRNYGLIGGTLLLALLLYPFTAIRSISLKSYSCLLISYLFYLVMSFSNPLLFSSSGMLILALVLTNKSLYEIGTKQLKII